MTRIAVTFLLAGTFSFLLSGCGEPEPPQPEIDREDAAHATAQDAHTPDTGIISEVRYQCAEALQVQASYAQDSVTLHLQGETQVLEVLPRDASLAQAPSASGVRYANADLTWHSKGSEALLSAADDTYVCLQMSH
ncbi:MliC family protein [Isoalcanivorax indicus]|uniref:MliC family protein n=1 Tax=Isoalcanivorax indicus TaxID=2202653 RepID=UPI000DB99B50|nr:MliC family protein [Isoalcanivorax indicus]